VNRPRRDLATQPAAPRCRTPPPDAPVSRQPRRVPVMEKFAVERLAGPGHERHHERPRSGMMLATRSILSSTRLAASWAAALSDFDDRCRAAAAAAAFATRRDILSAISLSVRP